MGTVIVLGSLITDLVARAPRLPLPGESLIGDEFAIFLGGKGFNQAIAAARLGASVTMIGRVGTDTFGDAFFPVLSTEGINSAYITRDLAAGTGVSCLIIAADSGQNVIVVLPRANRAVSTEAVETAIHATLTQRASPGVFLAQCETNMAALVSGLRVAREAGMTTILNLAPIPREPLADDLFALVDILVANEIEAASLAGITVDSSATAKLAAEQLLVRGPQHVIITLGAQGAVWSTYEIAGRQPSHQEISAISVTQLDATAAGDAFCGALAADLAGGMTMEAALRQANAAGALTVTRPGAFPSLPTAAEVEALLDGCDS